MTDDELKTILTNNITKDLRKQYINGLMAGWKACAIALNKQCSSLTSAKTIKEILKEAASKEYTPYLTENSD